jgi:integrase
LARRALRWRDVDLAGGWLHVQDAKTDAGHRRVKIRGALRDELLAVRSRHQARPDEYLFATASGRAPSRHNVRNRVLTPAAKLASRRLVERRLTPLPDRVTPHSLRRTSASLLYALGEDPGIVMDEMGHTDPALALRVYRQAMRRDEGEKARLRAIMDGFETAVIGSRPLKSEMALAAEGVRRHRKTPPERGFSERARQDLNLRPSAPEADALSPELRALD